VGGVGVDAPSVISFPALVTPLESVTNRYAVPVVNDPALTVAVIEVSAHAVGVQTARLVQLV